MNNDLMHTYVITYAVLKTELNNSLSQTVILILHHNASTFIDLVFHSILINHYVQLDCSMKMIFVLNVSVTAEMRESKPLLLAALRHRVYM